MNNYEKIRIYRNKINHFARYTGIETIELSDGYAKSRMLIRPEFGNTINSLHGGAIFTLADTVSGAAAASGGVMHTTVNSTMNFLKPGIGVEALYGTAYRIKKGKTISVYDVKITDDKENLYATGTFTYFNLNKPLVIEEPDFVRASEAARV